MLTYSLTYKHLYFRFETWWHTQEIHDLLWLRSHTVLIVFMTHRKCISNYIIFLKWPPGTLFITFCTKSAYAVSQRDMTSNYDLCPGHTPPYLLCFFFTSLLHHWTGFVQMNEGVFSSHAGLKTLWTQPYPDVCEQQTTLAWMSSLGRRQWSGTTTTVECSFLWMYQR